MIIEQRENGLEVIFDRKLDTELYIINFDFMHKINIVVLIVEDYYTKKREILTINIANEEEIVTPPK